MSENQKPSDEELLAKFTRALQALAARSLEKHDPVDWFRRQLTAALKGVLSSLPGAIRVGQILVLPPVGRRGNLQGELWLHGVDSATLTLLELAMVDWFRTNHPSPPGEPVVPRGASFEQVVAIFAPYRTPTSSDLTLKHLHTFLNEDGRLNLALLTKIIGEGVRKTGMIKVLVDANIICGTSDFTWHPDFLARIGVE